MKTKGIEPPINSLLIVLCMNVKDSYNAREVHPQNSEFKTKAM